MEQPISPNFQPARPVAEQPAVTPVNPNTPPGAGEGLPRTPQGPEVLPPVAAEAQPVVSQGMPVVPPIDPAIMQTASQGQLTSNDNQDDTNPAIADEVDVIEKAWVDRAKRVVEQTKSDPYEQEKKASELQADYLLKRYGREVKIAED